MIYAYGVTQQGPCHVKSGQVCQDAHKYIKCSEHLAVGAITDGLGSELYSDMASRLAADTSVEYCTEHIDESTSDDDILTVIHDAFTLAQDTIEHEAKERGYELDQCDTTLSLVVFKDGIVYYGHSGDGGIIVYTESGMYKSITQQQRDDHGRVFPLFFREEKWVFGKFEERVSSVMLATDGMFEIFFPVYIREEPVNIYVALSQFFMDKESLGVQEKGEEILQGQMNEFIANISEAQVNDDKTVLVIIDSNIEVHLQTEEYYKEPDWQKLKRAYEDAWKRKAYPHLFKE